ncbi:hypothetical protein NP493_1314g00065 [Ridgeia piscesae]|uniref:Nipped-B protein n=1 Tax=Ridgeia piscesae TaxID=27915 RepID=A0AAD9K9I4_RIDPI|nr:hypothetical protein NP493_1314g00065 [Ridgeia piscesae]
MCMRMIRRVNDEDRIKKLVNDTFQSMRGSHEDRQLQRVMNITDVVTMCRDTCLDWFEQLLENLFKKEENSNSTPVEQACEQIVNCLVENILRIEEHSAEAGATCSSRLISCFNTLYLFCKVKPELLIPHANTIQPYLNIKCSTLLSTIHGLAKMFDSPNECKGDDSQTEDAERLHGARILELALPLMDHPGESFLAQLEEDMIKLVLKHGMLIKAMQGIKMSYRLQEILQQDPSEPIRGIRTDDDNIISLNSFIYSLIRSNRGQRRAMLQSLLNMFDETGVFFPGAADDDRAKLEDMMKG